MPFDRIYIINTAQTLCIFTIEVLVLDSCLATKITSFTIFFIKCVAFDHLPFVTTGWQLSYLYAKPDMWMLYIGMWGHTYILTFTWEAWPLHWTVPPLFALYAVKCVTILKLWHIIFSQRSFTDHLSNSGLAVHVFLEFPFLPFELVIRVKNQHSCFGSLVLLSWDIIMEAKSDIKLRCTFQVVTWEIQHGKIVCKLKWA